MIEKIETAILNALEADAQSEGSALAKIKVERCPEDAATRLMSTAAGSAWIHFAGIKAGDPQGVYSAVQDDVALFDLDIIMRNLRTGRKAIVTDRAGAYDVISRVRFVLTGLKPVLSAKPMYMTNCELTDAGSGFWHYTMRFAVRVPYFAEHEEAEPAIATQVTWQHRNGKQFTIPKEEE